MFCRFVLCVSLLFCSVAFAQNKEIESKLHNAAIVSFQPMQDVLKEAGHTIHFSSSVSFVELESGAKAVLKTGSAKSVVAEVAAYKAALYFGLPFVPPTAIYKTEKITGSLQVYVAPTSDLIAGKNYKNFLTQLSEQDKANIQLFDFVLGNWDRDKSNIIASKNDEGKTIPILIDNAAIAFPQKVQYGDYAFVNCWPNFAVTSDVDEPQTFPFDKKQQLQPQIDIVRTELGKFLDEKKIKTLCKLQMPLVFVIWRNRFWRQYGFGKPCCTQLFPKNTLQKLQELTLETVKRWFENDLDATWSDEFFQDFLERRDQIIKASQATLFSVLS